MSDRGTPALVHASVGDGPARAVHVAEVEELSAAEPAAGLAVELKPLRQAELFEIRWWAPDGEPDAREHAVLAASHWLFATGRAPGDEIEFRSPAGRLWAKRDGESIALCVPGATDPAFVTGSARIVEEGPPRDETPKGQPSATLLATKMPEGCGEGAFLNEILGSPDLPAHVPFFVCSFSLAPRGASDPHSHDSAEIWYIASGSGRVLSGGREIQVGRGDFVYLTPATTHQIVNTGEEPLEATSVCWSS